MAGTNHPNKYPVIYADPPWAWSKTPLKNRGAARTVEKEYPTMQPDEIAAMPVNDWAADNAALFLWVTSPKLQIGLDVMKAWGFDFKTVAFCWVKQNRKSGGLFLGMGFYTRANVELCLVGTKGKGLKRNDAGVRQVVEAPITEHSAKPEEVPTRIERLYDGPYLELFARQPRIGWDVWGNEVSQSCAVCERLMLPWQHGRPIHVPGARVPIPPVCDECSPDDRELSA